MLALVSLCAPLLAGRTFTSIERLRVKLVEQPIASGNGPMEIATDRLEPFARSGSAAALILRIANHGGGGRFSVAVDGVPACEQVVAEGSTRRIDCRITRWPSDPRNTTLSIAGPGSNWSLDYLEVATHHGNTTGMIVSFVLPAGAHRMESVGRAAAIAICFAIVLGALAISPSPLPGPLRVVQRTLGSLSFVLLCLVLVSPWLSPFELVISFGTYLLCVVILGTSRIWTALLWFARPAAAGVTQRIARASLAAAVVALTFLAFVDAKLATTHDGNYSGFLQISRQFFDQNPLVRDRDDLRRELRLRPDGGYDGQFLFFAALDPLMRVYRHDPHQYGSVVDNVPYRYGRIGFSLLTAITTLNRPRAFPKAMVWLVLAGLGAAGFCLSLLASGRSLSAALGLLVLLVPGFWQSVQSALPEPVAAAFLLAGVLILRSGRPLLAGCLLAMSLLVRETGIVAVGLVGAGMIVRGRRHEAMALLSVAVLPVVLWRLYVGFTLYPEWGLKGFLDHPADLTWPVAGMAQMWRVIQAGAYYGGSHDFARAGLSFPVVLVSGFVLALALTVRRPSAFSVAALVYALIAVSLNYEMIWVHIANGQRGTYELFLMLALCSLDLHAYPRTLKGFLVAFWCLSLYYVFVGAFDAAEIRAAIGLPV